MFPELYNVGKKLSLLTIAVSAGILFSGCVPSPGTFPPPEETSDSVTENPADSSDDTSDTADTSDTDSPENYPPGSAYVPHDCEWDQPKLDLERVTIPLGKEGQLQDVAIGFWQMIPPDVLSGEIPDPDFDVRWIIPNQETFSFCQTIDGVVTEFTQGFHITENEFFIVEQIGSDPADGYGMRYEVMSWNQDFIYIQGEFRNDALLLARR